MTNNDAAVNTALSKMVTLHHVKTTSREQNLKALLWFGKHSSEIKRVTPSSKLHGIELARRFPESKKMDSALRCWCTWLYDALNMQGHPESDILKVLGLREIKEICSKTGNSTVIRRLYMEAKAKAKLAAKDRYEPHAAVRIARRAEAQHQSVCPINNRAFKRCQRSL